MHRVGRPTVVAGAVAVSLAVALSTTISVRGGSPSREVDAAAQAEPHAPSLAARPAEPAAPIVSNAMLDRSFRQGVTCVESQGVEASFTHDGIGGFEYSVSAGTESEIAKMHDKIDACLAAFRDVSRDYLRAYGPSTEEHDAADQESLRCLDAGGMPARSLDDAWLLLEAEAGGLARLGHCFREGPAYLQDLVRSRASEE